jgi:hypothetical protein
MHADDNPTQTLLLLWQSRDARIASYARAAAPPRRAKLTPGKRRSKLASEPRATTPRLRVEDLLPRKGPCDASLAPVMTTEG